MPAHCRALEDKPAHGTHCCSLCGQLFPTPCARHLVPAAPTEAASMVPFPRGLCSASSSLFSLMLLGLKDSLLTQYQKVAFVIRLLPLPVGVSPSRLPEFSNS